MRGSLRRTRALATLFIVTYLATAAVVTASSCSYAACNITISSQTGWETTLANYVSGIVVAQPTTVCLTGGEYALASSLTISHPFGNTTTLLGCGPANATTIVNGGQDRLLAGDHVSQLAFKQLNFVATRIGNVVSGTCDLEDVSVTTSAGGAFIYYKTAVTGTITRLHATSISTTRCVLMDGNGLSVSIYDSTFESVDGTTGGAVYCATDETNELRIYSSSFTNCSPSQKAAVWAGKCVAEIYDTEFEGNALTAVGSFGETTIAGCTFDSNTGGRRGSAIAYESDGRSLRVVNSTFINNDGATQYGGGAIYAAGPNITMTGNTFTYNTATSGNGGAVALETTTTGSSLVFTDNTVSGNVAADGDGGGLHIFVRAGSPPPVVRDNEFNNNYADRRGGGVEVNGTGSSVALHNNNIECNAAVTGAGGLHSLSGAVTVYANDTTVRTNLKLDSRTAWPAAAVSYPADVISNVADTAGEIKFLPNTPGGEVRDCDLAPGDFCDCGSGNCSLGNATTNFFNYTCDCSALDDEQQGTDCQTPVGCDHVLRDTHSFRTTVQGWIDARDSSSPLTICLIDPVYTYGGGALTVGPAPASAVVIRGYGAARVVVDLAGSSFIVGDDTPVTVRHLDFVNGVARVLYTNGGRLDVVDCMFRGIQATVYGCAIYGEYSANVTVVDSAFYNTTVTSNDAPLAVWYSSSLNITDTEFVGGHARYGAAINVLFSSSLTLTDSLFDSNTATLEDGTINVETSSSAVVRGCTFINNNSPINSVLEVADGVYTIEGNVFASNTASNQNTIRFDGSTGTFSDNTVRDNVCAINCGVRVNGGSGTISASVFSFNTASNYAGALIVASATLSVTGCEFSYNTADGLGGAIYTYSSTLMVTSSSILHNTATNANGGGIRLDNGYTLLTNVDCIGNTAGSTDGGGCVYAQGDVWVTDSTFANNTATTGAGGAIKSRKDGVEPIVQLTDSTFHGNTGTSGGAVFADGGAVDASGCTFTSNSGSYGGALRLSSSDNVGYISLVDCSVASNTAQWQGGAIYTVKSISVADSVFAGNTAPSSGGAIYLAATNVNITEDLNVTRSTFRGNTATAGAVFGVATLSGLRVSDSLMEANTAGSTCAVFWALSSITVIHNSVLRDNWAGGTNGIGAATSPFVVTGSTFSRNYAAGSYNLEFTVSGSFVNNTMDSNSCGGSYCGLSVGGLNTTLAHCNFTNNTAGGSAAALYWGSPALGAAVERCRFESNNATNGTGGAVALGTGAAVTFVNSSFVANSASGSAGAVKPAGDLAFVACSFVSNTAGSSGGAVVATDVLSVTDCEFSGNVAGGSGGALYGSSAGVDIHVVGGNADGNVAGSNGGCVSVLAGSSLSMENVSVSDNSAGAAGGGVFVNGSTGTVVNCVLSANTAEYGGALAAVGAAGSATVTGGVASCNVAQYGNDTRGAGFVAADSAVVTVDSTVVAFSNYDLLPSGAFDSGGSVYPDHVLSNV